MPFLIELAENESTPERHRILWLLGHLANGSSYIDQHKSMIREEDYKRMFGEDFDYHGTLEKEKQWVRNARLAVREGIPLYQRLLEHPEAKVRASAAWLLGVTGPHEEEVLQSIRRALASETDSLPKAGLMMALAELQDSSSATLQPLRRKLEDDRRSWTGLIAAISLSMLGERDRFVLDTLVHHLKNTDPVIEELFVYLVRELDFMTEIVLQIAQFPEEEKSLALNELIEAFQEQNRPAYDFEMLLHITFEETNQAKFRSISDLTDEQKKILMIYLNFLKDHEHIWLRTTVLNQFGFSAL